MRVVIADDSVLLRAGLVRLLEDADFEVVAQASDAEDLLRKVRAHKPDVAVTDTLRRVGEGGSALDPEVVSQLLGRRRANDPLDRLTPREREVLGHMAE